VANFIWVTATRVTVRTVHIPAGSVAHKLTRTEALTIFDGALTVV
jgi:hypothetical protein